MKALIQRVLSASVTVENEVVGQIGSGLLVLLGVGHNDTVETSKWMAEKAVKLRIFGDDDGKFNRSLLDIEGEMLVVSQFTLFGDARKGTRPSFTSAAPPELANSLYEQFCRDVHELGVTVAQGVFAAHMQISLVNDGPVTLQLER